MSTKQESKKPLPKLKPEVPCAKQRPCAEAIIKPFVNLSDFEGTYCGVCMMTLAYQKKKPLKKGEQEPESATYEQPKVQKVKVAKVKKAETPKVEGPKPPEVQPETPVVAETPKAEPLMKEFPLYKAGPVKGLDHLLCLTFATDDGEEFSVIVETEPEKVAAFIQNADKLVGKKANIQFEGWVNDLPSTPVFKGFVK
jgi:outer membrane biosynthesis protein TonB